MKRAVFIIMVHTKGRYVAVCAYGDGIYMNAHSVNVCSAWCHEVYELHVCLMDSPPSLTYNRLHQPAAAGGVW